MDLIWLLLSCILCDLAKWMSEIRNKINISNFFLRGRHDWLKKTHKHTHTLSKRLVNLTKDGILDWNFQKFNEKTNNYKNKNWYAIANTHTQIRLFALNLGDLKSNLKFLRFKKFNHPIEESRVIVIIIIIIIRNPWGILFHKFHYFIKRKKNTNGKLVL